MTLGAALRIVRSALGMSLSEAAKAAGLSVAMLNLAERDERSLSTASLEKLGEVYGAPVDLLISLASPESGIRPADQRMLSTLATMQHMEDELRTHLKHLKKGDQ